MNQEGSVERSREQFNIVYETVYGGIIMIHIEEVSVILMLMFGVVVSYFICTNVSVTLWYSDPLQKCTVRPRQVSILIYLAL